ncbi:hypothetical protein CWI36_1579p0010 [Hamiltosporidium magnivora]|uniref:Type 1 phosphatases regulator n=1 Tax=Hamiltosporidium magnivora TaxID=148818 RepID=A0A4Q9L1G2_9MICR|nr:hypothetical protein CWI36_1579p0010 [Hamiltosporidium magnivora]
MNQPNNTRTQTITPSNTRIITLRLITPRRVTFTPETYNNEHSNNKKSNVCCIYHIKHNKKCVNKYERT